MDIIFIALITAISIEYVFYTPTLNIFQLLQSILKTSLKVVISQRISDHWKERVLIRYAYEITKNSSQNHATNIANSHTLGFGSEPTLLIA